MKLIFLFCLSSLPHKCSSIPCPVCHHHRINADHSLVQYAIGRARQIPSSRQM
ncbi:hypothetical protein M758_5G158700 [Ceratodon purpureus]|uniref:Uncharacterized protein n=1 Tax=Ceratodon purpureus TaxID=3225 RepID=A0A8T0I3S5_CERPU|nr:hypothetical protein KC19_5G166000 [Ceratodon purpureus]KAG0617016.1 hypothetical protein M758_5G158700 [Ceratodon purpureus]